MTFWFKNGIKKQKIDIDLQLLKKRIYCKNVPFTGHLINN